ncbi:single-stranded-DNA-specific exonuclease RecJ [Patescibacteria group bacterium]|nr:single-stranded-DNA-specific exonuclease RecJ [Patescibacteria group bacterium]
MSTQKTEWKVLKKIPKKTIARFGEYNPLVVQLADNRGLKTQKDIDEFFNPDYKEDLHDPYLMTDMRRAVKRILKAKKSGEEVGICGDFDTDGVTASTLLTELLRGLKISGKVYLPDREKEGYGINKNAIDWLFKKGVTLIITCDCGVSNKKEIDYAKKEHGIDVIVLDHHHVPVNFSKEYIVVDPKRKGDTYPFKELCAAGVVFKLIEAFYRYEKDSLCMKNKEAFVKWLLDLVAIGTVADCVPLLHENRTLTTYGLTVLNKTKRIGIKELSSVASLPKEVTSYHIGFLIAPRINAAGRIDHANVGYKLMVSKTAADARRYAEKLEATNKERQRLTEKVYKEAKALITKKQEKKKIIIVSKENWPQGTLGIVAGKLTRDYFRPAIVVTKGKKGYAASSRGPECFSLVDAISECKEYLETFGGHRQAAGMTIIPEKYEAFVKKMEQIAGKKITAKMIVENIEVDAKITLADVNWDTHDAVSKMEPFGEGNPAPAFLIEGVTLTSKKAVGKEGKHVKIAVDDENGLRKQGIGFSLTEKLSDVKIGDMVDIVCRLSVNEWNGKRELEVMLLDLKISSKKRKRK